MTYTWKSPPGPRRSTGTSARRAPARWGLALTTLLGALSGCSERSGSAAPDFAVVQVLPEAASSQPAELLLNQELTIQFSAPLDPSSITPDTVRVLDRQGLRVGGELRVASQRVTFVPRSPVEPDLEDGSFAPGETYTLEVVGFPRANAVRSAEGRLLGASIRRRFQAVAADANPALIPTDSPFGFALDGGQLGMAAGSERLRLYFHEEPHPATVRPDAFRVIRLRAGGGHEFEEIVPSATELRALPRPYPQLPGWAVDLKFDEPPVEAPDVLAVKLVGGEHMLRDPTGQAPRLVEIHDDGSAEWSDLIGLPLLVRVYAGEWVPLLEERFEGAVGFQGLGPAPRFEARGGRAVPLVRVEAGNGALGLLSPHTDTVLQPGRAFDRGDGSWVKSEGAEFDFTGIFVPRGCKVRIRGGREDGPIVLRACAGVRIDGELVLEGTPRRPPMLPLPQPGSVSLNHLLEAAGVAIVAGGDVLVTGQIRWEPGPDPDAGEQGSPLTILGVGGLALFGRIPEQSVLATEPGGAINGTAQGFPFHVTVADLTPGLPVGISTEARAWTEWMALPRSRMSPGDEVEVELRGASPGLIVEMQAAPPDAVNTSRPDDRPEALLSLVPSSTPSTLPADGFVRFLLRAPVRGGEPLPSLDGIVLRAAR